MKLAQSHPRSNMHQQTVYQ